MHNNIDKNRGAHGDSSFMLDGLLSSRENPIPKSIGNVQKLREGFLKPVENQTEDKFENVWTHEDMLEIAKKILKRMGCHETKLY